MSMTSHAMPTAEGYESPYVTQFSVFLDNRVGQLMELLEVFDDQALLIVALSVVDSSDHAVVRLVTTQSPLARKLLEDNDFAFAEAEILVIEVTDSHQTLTPVCVALIAAEINIHYIYPLMVRPHGNPTIAIHTDNQTMAAQVLRRRGHPTLREEDLRDSDPPASNNPFVDFDN